MLVQETRTDQRQAPVGPSKKRPAAPASECLRGPFFDGALIGGTACIALASGLISGLDEELFAVFLTQALWLLSYHHNAATMTRLVFDSESFRRHRFLVLGLPFLVFGMTLAIGMGLGLWVVMTIYVYWQWFHYTRQSFGIWSIYRRRSRARSDFEEKLGRLMLDAVAIGGLLWRTSQPELVFFGRPLTVLPVPRWLAAASLIVVGGIVALWLGVQIRAMLRGAWARTRSLYALSHLLIFAVSYLAIEDLGRGWFVINTWHNAQYLLVVWHHNNRRFRDGPDPKHPFLSAISQESAIPIYLIVCLGLGALVMKPLFLAEDGLGAWAMPYFFVLFQSINFHHYIVDGVIWRLRKPELSAVLDLTPNPDRSWPTRHG